jgi:hypothetical protein
MTTISAASILHYKESLSDDNISVKDFLLHAKNFAKDNKLLKVKSTRLPSAYNIFMKDTIKMLKENEDPSFVNTKRDNTTRFAKAASMWKDHKLNNGDDMECNCYACISGGSKPCIKI